MLKSSYGISELRSRKTLTAVILVANAFIWYYVVFSFLQGRVSPVLSVSSVTIWGFHFSGLIISALVGTLIAKRIEQDKLLIVWMTAGVISSLTLFAANTSNVILLSLIGLLLGISLGFGMPTCMNRFSDNVSVENRGRTSAMIMVASGIGIFAFTIVSISSVIILGVVLAAWRIASLAIFLSVKSSVETVPKSKIVSYKEILNQQSFILYFVPWTMFCLVDYLVSPLYSISISGNLTIIQTVFMGVFAVLGGFFLDSFGRRFVAIFGFIVLGIGSAFLGISTTNTAILYFNAIVDGIAWGFLLVLFMATIWGDLSYISRSDIFYAIGVSPFFISAFLGLTVGPYILSTLKNSALFSFGAFFLFLAVLPLLYAPETLYEKTIRARELKDYLAKAQKLAHQATGKNNQEEIEKAEDADEEAQESPVDEEARKLAEKYY